MRITRTTLDIGLSAPFTALHLSDTHVALADERDDERKRALAVSRSAYFNQPTGDNLALFEQQIDYACTHGLPVLYTGDILDFVSFKNLEYAKAQLDRVDYFLCAGNHEYSQYVGEAFEDVAYRMQTYALVQAYFKNNLLCDSRVMGGINFVAMDDGYYRFDAGQLRRLKLEVSRGLPIVLLLHNPLHTQKLYDYAVNVDKQPCAYLTGTPEALMTGYSEDRRVQQKPDDDTLHFIDYVNHEPAIRAILAGHLHFDFEDALPSDIPQIVTGGGFRDCAREITFR